MPFRKQITNAYVDALFEMVITGLRTAERWKTKDIDKTAGSNAGRLNTRD
jgi:hypothetical protein